MNTTYTSNDNNRLGKVSSSKRTYTNVTVKPYSTWQGKVMALVGSGIAYALIQWVLSLS